MEETHNMGRGGSMTLEQMGKKAKQAARVLASAGMRKDEALCAIAAALEMGCDKILEAVSYTHLPHPP